VLLGDARLYQPDASEQALPDAAAARRLLGAQRPDILGRLSAVAERFASGPRALEVALLGTARLGLRHGSFGGDFHAYHNEMHVLEVGERRLLRMLAGMGAAAPGAEDIAALLMFAACHDLRQREPVDPPGPVGGNEAASGAEALRILDACGFDRQRDRQQYVALELMIAGSTFDTPSFSDPVSDLFADPPSSGLSDPPADPGQELSGGSLARGLARWLDSCVPRWREDGDARRGERLARLAADLDTANVGEQFVQLCETGLRLCREREMRAGRRLDGAESAQPCLQFLGRGQEYYFYRQHRFNSREGERVFGPQKLVNGPLVRAATQALLARFAGRAPGQGVEVLAAFSELTGAA
jgi:hypothetical protein